MDLELYLRKKTYEVSEVDFKWITLIFTSALTHFVAGILSFSTEKATMQIDPSVNSILVLKIDKSLFDTSILPFNSLLISFA
jgi:hypothetical protein